MGEQPVEQVDRYVGDPPLPEEEGGAAPPIEEKTGQDQSLAEDAAAAAMGSPAEDIEHTGKGADTRDNRV
jgi:hypothetical protein